jgi:hypothetical protein
VQENLIDGEEKSLEVDTKYLKLLGFTDEATKFYPTNAWNNSSLPVIVTAVSGIFLKKKVKLKFPFQFSNCFCQVAYDEGFNAIGFARNAQHFAPNHTVLMYNIGLGQTELENVKIILFPP